LEKILNRDGEVVEGVGRDAGATPSRMSLKLDREKRSG